MQDEIQNFCPLLQRECREDCSWYHTFYQVDEDGVGRWCYCAVNVIANELCRPVSDEI